LQDIGTFSDELRVVIYNFGCINPFSTTIFAHSTLISGPIDSKPSANERELNVDKVGLFSHSFPSTANLARSSYVGETNVVAKAIDSPINRTPCIALAKPMEINRTFVFHPFLDYPLSNGQFDLFKTKLTVSLRTEVIPLGVKLKVAIKLSIHSIVENSRPLLASSSR
jgi:hypothetical protein